MKTRVLFLLVAMIMVGLMPKVNVFAQTDSVYWPVTQALGYYTSMVNGNLTADKWTCAKVDALYGVDSMGSYLFSSGSWTVGGTDATVLADPDFGQRLPRIDCQNIYPGQTAAGWPTLATDTLENIWLQFRVTPKAGYNFHVNSVSFDICGSGTGSMKAKAFISTDPYFSYKTQILDTTGGLASYIFKYVRVEGIDTVVNDGQSFFVRIYPWYHNQAAAVTGKRVIVKRVIVKGTTEVANPVPVELTSFTATTSGSAAKLHWTTATEANNLGFEVERKRGGVVNCWTKIGFVAGAGTSANPNDYSYTDNASAGSYVYRLKQVDNDGTFKYSREVEIMVGAKVKEFKIYGAYPNPFNPSSKIQFSFGVDGFGSLKIYNTIGQHVATLFEGNVVAGTRYEEIFNALNLSSGLYFARLESAGQIQVQKLMLMK
ncbi:MAG: T9SS type A sorting domain-containing protein [Ignavibacteria bacterium]|nr:T9SS type A sorting domain-containing protein [Ignavibacteria bacterium]